MYLKYWLKNLSTSFDNVHCKILQKDHSLENGFNEAKKLFNDVKNKTAKIVIIGNGGSSAIASHISQDIINKLKISSLVISDASLITCISNDFGYENGFSKPLEVLLNENDVLIAISDSGESKNILNSIQVAKNKKCHIITLSAFKQTNSLFNTDVDVAFHVPTDNYGIAEVSHLTILHTWVDELAGVELEMLE